MVIPPESPDNGNPYEDENQKRNEAGVAQKLFERIVKVTSDRHGEPEHAEHQKQVVTHQRSVLRHLVNRADLRSRIGLHRLGIRVGIVID